MSCWAYMTWAALMVLVLGGWGLYQFGQRMDAEAALYGARVALKDPSISEERVEAWEGVWDE